MAGPRRARGFTLVELLVVITIIGMLMALLLPAIQSAREAGRRNTCSNNIRQVALAVSNSESAKRSYPGYANVVNGKRASWVVLLLPYMERNDIYGLWQTQPAFTAVTQFVPPPTTSQPGPVLGVSGNATAVIPNPYAYTFMNILICPSNPKPDQGGNPLSYVVNCGSAFSADDNITPRSAGTFWKEDVYSGVFFNHCNWDTIATSAQDPLFISVPGKTPPGGGPKVTQDFISTHDGTSNTLMASENLQASNWATDPAYSIYSGAVDYPFQSDFQVKQCTGFVWFLTRFKDNAYIDPVGGMGKVVSALYNVDTIQINAGAQGAPDPMSVSYSPPASMQAPAGLTYSRPSSQHPGGVNTMFCDGHLRFISDEVNYNVYTQLMSPSGKAVKVDKNGNNALGKPGNTTVWTYTLSDLDY